MSRICYFKQHGSTGLALASDLADVVSSVDAKADASVVTAYSGTVDAKADAVNVYLQTTALGPTTLSVFHIESVPNNSQGMISTDMSRIDEP